MVVTKQDLQQALRALNLSGQVVCLHSSLSSFGRVAGGAKNVVEAFLEVNCTILVPTFSSAFAINPPEQLKFERNGWNYNNTNSWRDDGRIYTPESIEIDSDMGAIPEAVISLPGHVRGDHPLDSFTAVGQRAHELVAGQTPSNVYAPLRALIGMRGFVLLMGVGLERMTLLHLAEKEAGRTLFRRWALDRQGQPMAVEVGGCSEGFGKLEPNLFAVMRTTNVGSSLWKLFPAEAALNCAAAEIRVNPQVTHCEAKTCERCNDAVAGGTILSAGWM